MSSGFIQATRPASTVFSLQWCEENPSIDVMLHTYTKYQYDSNHDYTQRCIQDEKSGGDR